MTIPRVLEKGSGEGPERVRIGYLQGVCWSAIGGIPSGAPENPLHPPYKYHIRILSGIRNGRSLKKQGNPSFFEKIFFSTPMKLRKTGFLQAHICNRIAIVPSPGHAQERDFLKMFL